MREKLRNKKGFTLAELLIVVAIIAVLVAIMIPVFGASRAKAVLARDTANLRSAYAEQLMDAMATTNDVTGISVTITKDTDIKGDFDCEVTKLDGSSPGGVIEVKNSAGSEKIYVDDDVTVTLTGFNFITP